MMPDHENHVQEELKSLDAERYLACLYLPEAFRNIAITLYAFDAEISRIPDLVSEPMPGEVRIQWWRDLIKSDGNVGSSPLAETLLETIKVHKLPRETFDNYLEARIFDLYQDPMPDIGSYEGYLGETVSSFLNLIALSAGCERNTALADACGHAGVAIGISRHLSLCVHSRRRGQLFFPLSVLKKHKFDRNHWLMPKINHAHEAVVLEMTNLAKKHLEKAKIAISKLPIENRIVFLPVVFSENLLQKIAMNPSECLNKPVVLSPLKRQWLAFRGAGKL